MNNESQWIYTEAIAFIIFTPVHNLRARMHARARARTHVRTPRTHAHTHTHTHTLALGYNLKAKRNDRNGIYRRYWTICNDKLHVT